MSEESVVREKLLQYSGYFGSIEVSLEDNCLCGSIQFIRDLVTYEAESPAALESAFRQAVDNYLQTCRINGLEPDKSFSGTFNVRIHPDAHRNAAIQALKLGVSLNEFVAQCIESALKRRVA